MTKLTQAPDQTQPLPEIWVDLAGQILGADLWSALLNAPIDVVLLRLEQLPSMPMPGHIRVACMADEEYVIERALKEEMVDIVVVQEEARSSVPARVDKAIGVRARIGDQDAVLRCIDLLRHVDALIVELVDETNIPLELLIAEAQSTDVDVVKRVATAEDALITLGVLESGTRGILFPVERFEQVSVLAQRLEAMRRVQLHLTKAEVVSSTHAGMGYRGCIDTASLFAKDEGILVGSTSHGGILVCAEVHYLPYMNLRPFRVNAGAVHSYVWTPGGRTAYVTDLSVGTQALAVSTSGVARPVLVGRVKTEVRPLRLIVAEADGTRLNVLVQDDWHVRVFDGEGEVRNVSTIKPGDQLLSYVCDPGRHVGIKVNETIEEW